MQIKKEDLESLLIQLDSQINAPELNETELLRLVNELDALLLSDLTQLNAIELSTLKPAYDTYLAWIEQFVSRCAAEKLRISEELVLLKRRKNAKEHYQR